MFDFLVKERYTVDCIPSEFPVFMLVKVYIVAVNLLHALFALWLLLLVKKIFLLGPRRHLLQKLTPLSTLLKIATALGR